MSDYPVKVDRFPLVELKALDLGAWTGSVEAMAEVRGVPVWFNADLLREAVLPRLRPQAKCRVFLMVEEL